MRILFLDLDGVCNSTETCSYYHNLYKCNGYGGFFKEHEEEPSLLNVLFGQHLVNQIKRILDDCTDVKIVMSTTWRMSFSVKCFIKMFQLYGITDPPIIDKTPIFNTIRGKEIDHWLKNHPEVTQYVIIDDSSDMLPDQMENFVKVNPSVGLRKKDALKAIEILNKKN